MCSGKKGSDVVLTPFTLSLSLSTPLSSLPFFYFLFIDFSLSCLSLLSASVSRLQSHSPHVSSFLLSFLPFQRWSRHRTRCWQTSEFLEELLPLAATFTGVTGPSYTPVRQTESHWERSSLCLPFLSYSVSPAPCGWATRKWKQGFPCNISGDMFISWQELFIQPWLTENSEPPVIGRSLMTSHALAVFLWLQLNLLSEREWF